MTLAIFEVLWETNKKKGVSSVTYRVKLEVVYLGFHSKVKLLVLKFLCIQRTSFAFYSDRIKRLWTLNMKEA